MAPQPISVVAREWLAQLGCELPDDTLWVTIDSDKEVYAWRYYAEHNDGRDFVHAPTLTRNSEWDDDHQRCLLAEYLFEASDIPDMLGKEASRWIFRTDLTILGIAIYSILPDGGAPYRRNVGSVAKDIAADPTAPRFPPVNWTDPYYVQMMVEVDNALDRGEVRFVYARYLEEAWLRGVAASEEWLTRRIVDVTLAKMDPVVMGLVAIATRDLREEIRQLEESVIRKREALRKLREENKQREEELAALREQFDQYLELHRAD